MSIGTASMYEALLQHDRPIAWWGLDTSNPLEDDSGHGYTLTAVAAPVNATTLISHGDTGLSGCRDFNGSTMAYFTEGDITDVPAGPPAFHAVESGQGTATVTASMASPTGVIEGDLMIAVLVSNSNAATMSSAPAGWTQIGTTQSDTQASTAAYRKTATAADELASILTWTWSTSATLAHAIFVYRGCDPDVANLIFDSSCTALTSAVNPQVTPTETFPDGSRMLVVWTADSSTFDDITPEQNDYTSRLELGTGAGSQPILIAGDYTEETAGSRSRQATTEAADQMTVTVVTFGAPRVTVYDKLDVISEHLSIHAIVRPDTVSGIDTIIGKEASWHLRLSAGVVQFRYVDGASNLQTVTGPTLSASTTYHLVVTDDGTNIHFYRNGVETTATRTGAAGYLTNFSEPIVIGAAFAAAVYSNFFDGRLDEIAVWDCCVSDDMVATWYEGYSAGTFGETHLGGSKPTPRVKLEVAWESAPVDDCLVWRDVTEFCQGASTSRGRNFELDRMETGRMDFELRNTGGEFLPDDNNSPYYPNVIPTRPVRFRAQSVTDGPVYPLFFGYTEGHPVIRPGSGFDSRARFTAADPMKALSLDKVLEQSVRETELSGARIEAVLAGIEGIPADVDAGQSEVVGDDLLGLNRLDHVQTVGATDGGVVFSDGAGVIQFQDRHYRVINEATSRATYGDGSGSELPFILLEVEIDEARLFTTAAITPASGNVKTYEDEEAVRQHYRRAKEVQTLHAQDNDAQAMAEGYVGRYSTPRVFIPGFDIRPVTTAAWTAALGHELSHRISTIDRPLGGDTVTREHFIEKIEHTISTGDWRMKLGVSPAELESGYWLLGVGELGDTTGRTATVLGW